MVMQLFFLYMISQCLFFMESRNAAHATHRFLPQFLLNSQRVSPEGGSSRQLLLGLGFLILGVLVWKNRELQLRTWKPQTLQSQQGDQVLQLLCLIHSATSGIRTQPQLCCITQDPRGDQNQSWFQSLNPWQKTGAQLPVLGSNKDSGVTPRLLHLKITISICKSNQRFGTFQTWGASSSSRDKEHLLKFLVLCLQHRLLSPLLHSSFQHLLDPAGWQPLNEKVLCVILSFFFFLNRKFWCQTRECLKFSRRQKLGMTYEHLLWNCSEFLGSDL